MAIINPMVAAAESIKDMINDETFSKSFTATREYILYQRLAKITDLTVFVSPTEREVEPETRGKDSNLIGISVTIMDKTASNTEVDDLMNLSEEIYRLFKRGELDGLEGYGLSGVTSPTIYSPDMLATANLYAAEITFNVKRSF